MGNRIQPTMWLIGVNNSRAFTLVEVMISVLILGVGLTSVANSYILALRGANSAGNNISALIIAKEKLENLELASLKGAEPFSSAAEIIKSATKEYNYQQEITQIAESEDLAKYLVSACLTISWPEKNSSKNVTLATYLLKLAIPTKVGI
ncbi:MAG: prepilin-type N-terminal cleavage/methylation domain-containing protein [Candidatus Omnitrophica bacterium]|nr:prepilin-type N-terminal cleavage/methylation domain-containing protein [Candidatus Omnitrophota bacterium]